MTCVPFPFFGTSVLNTHKAFHFRNSLCGGGRDPLPSTSNQIVGLIIIDPLTSHSGTAHGELPSLFLSAVLFFFSYLVFLASLFCLSNPSCFSLIHPSSCPDVFHCMLEGFTIPQ